MGDPDLDRIINDLRARRERLTRLIHDAASSAADHAAALFEREGGKEPEEGEQEPERAREE